MPLLLAVDPDHVCQYLRLDQRVSARGDFVPSRDIGRCPEMFRVVTTGGGCVLLIPGA